MLDSVILIEKYIDGMESDVFLEDQKTKDAVVRNFEIIGEAATRIDSDFQRKNNSIAWNRLRGYRNRLIHEYFGVDYDIVWNIIINDLPVLKDDLNTIIEKL